MFAWGVRLLLAAVHSDAHSLRATHRMAVREEPFCIFSGRGVFEGHLGVAVSGDNVRKWGFGEGKVEETRVKCKGAPPNNCTMQRVPVGQFQTCDQLVCPCEQDTSSLQYPYMNQMMEVVTKMCRAAATNFDRVRRNDPFRLLIVGLGGGALPMHARSQCPAAVVETVEYDPRVIDVAVQFFGFHVTDKNRIERADGGQAVHDRAARGSRYDAVLVDAIDMYGNVPPSCEDKGFINNVKHILRSNGTFIQNIWSPQYEAALQQYSEMFGKDRVSGRHTDSGNGPQGLEHIIIAQA